MSTALRDELLDYAKRNFNDIHIIMNRLIRINTHPGDGSIWQGRPSINGGKEYYDGIFYFEIGGKIHIDLEFQSSGFSNNYSRRFSLDAYTSDKLEWCIRLFQTSETKKYDVII